MDLQARQLGKVTSAIQKRHVEALKLFRPLDHQKRIFTSAASELLIVGGNRSGKSICLGAFVSSVTTGIPIIGQDGKEIPFSFPKNRPLSIWLIGLGEEHIATTWHRLLFEEQPELKMIRDLETHRWRAYDPFRDAGREDYKSMPPFIPRRLIKRIGWKNKAINFFKTVEMKPRPEFGPDCKLGTRIRTYTSIGDVKKGDPVDLIAIDEEIAHWQYYAEWQARISDRKGRIVWAIAPDETKRRPNPALVNLLERCDADVGTAKPDCEAVRLRFSQNPYIDSDEKRKRMKGWDERTWRARDAGEIVVSDYLVYPQFTDKHHQTPALLAHNDDVVDRLIRENGGIPPNDWCRDLVLDPGHQHPGVLLCAMPPPRIKDKATGKEHHIGEVYVVYDELYLPQHDPSMLAKEVANKIRGQAIHRFIIDERAGRQEQMGAAAGNTVERLYAAAFDKMGLSCEATGSNFIFSSSSKQADISLVRETLQLDEHGRPKLRYTPGTCYNFFRMMARYYKARDKDGYVIDKPADRQIDPLCDCVRYYVASMPRYTRPRALENKGSGPYLEWKQLEEEKIQADSRAFGNSVFCGAGTPKQRRMFA